MDFYSYYKERFGWGPNPYQSTAMCQREVMELMNNHLIPMRIAAESAIGFLCALYDFAGDGCAVSFPFRIVKNALCNKLQSAHDAVEDMDREWAKEVMEAERADVDGPPYEPPEFECWDVDLAEEDYDGINDDPALARSELYGDGGEFDSTGTRTPFPDWEHIDSWTQSDWIKLQIYKDKVLAAAECGFMGISSVAGVLAATKEAINMIPLPRQVELGMWAEEIVDGLMFSMEDDLQKMLAGSLHSHQGRLVQKAMHSAANGQPKSDPD